MVRAALLTGHPKLTCVHHTFASTAEEALEKGDVKAELRLDDVLEDDSIYPEVRASVSNLDDPEMPVNTFRAWFIGLIFTIVISGLNQFFYFRYPSVTITALVAQLVAFPIGKAMAKVLPTKSWNTPLGSFSFNPGPFNIKEHTLITVMANVVYQRAYATDILAAQRFFYDQRWSAGYQILLVLSSQFVGFSFAGFCRRWLVWPAAMIWPSTLVQSALMNTLHHTQSSEQGRMSREKFFLFAFIGAWCWYWFPGYIFTALSSFSWIAWMAPKNIKVNQLFGISSGLGMGILTFDWAQIAYIGSPLVTPWFAEANVLAGFLFFYWFLTPILYYSNVWNAAYLPILASGSFDRFGSSYNVSMVTTPEGTFDRDAYNNYSQLYLSTTFALSYGLSFASITATIVHCVLYYRKDIVRQFKSSLAEEPDIHARLMNKYKEVPNWWYAAVFLISVALAIVTIEVWPTQLPVWALFLALAISALYILPIGIIYAITNQEVGLNVITEFIIGYALPGRPVAMMIFKTFGYIAMYQGVSFISDLKFGHYMKIPPRSMFMAQVIAAFISCFVLLGVQSWSFGNISGICTPDASDRFICPGTKVFSTASVIWGLIGPKLQFSAGQQYHALLYFFIIGAVMPIPTYFAAKRWPHSFLRYVSWPVIFTGTGLLPPATGINYASWALVGFIFQYLLRRRAFGWWSSFNYVLSAAMDSGTGLATIVIFFTVVYPKGKNVAFSNGNWWGNTVYTNTADWNATSWLTIDPDTGFAPSPLANGAAA